jgi:superfamily II DNA or RNA helicase
LLKQVWRLRDVPTSVLSKINIPSHDQGIDLIAETFEGKFWAIQCKYHGDSDKKVSHREISTFLALSNTVASSISFCLVITTADDYAKLYKGQSNIGFVLSDVWSELPEDFFTEFGKPKKQHLGTPREPRKHQQSAISDATKYFEKEDRGKLIFPCGAGKSLTGYWISKALKAKNVVVAVPSLALVKQTLDDYCRESLAEGNPIAPFCICSDEGIGKSDDVAVFSQDLGINCTTDREQIKDFLQLKTDRKKVIFTTYQSGRVLGDAIKEIPFEFDLGILDEAHKTVGAADKLFSFLLFDENVNIRKRIFMTATERRYKGSSDNILSMDDLEIYGDTFTQLSFKEAIDLEILSDYKIITLLITKDEVKEYLKQNDIVYGTELGDNAEVDFRTYASLIALRKAIDKYPIKHAVTFHGSIKRAKLFSELQEPFEEVYPKFSKVSAYHVTGAIPTGIRSKIVREFAGAEKAIITNAKCLTEGVDVPNIDCVLFADPRNSTVDIVQAVGRALRRAGDKEFGYVLLPIYSEEKNGESLLESEDFQNILSTLKALASNDERIVEFFRDKHSASNSAGVKDLVQFDVENIASGISINTTLLIEQLELKTWSRLAKLSWRSFDEAREFIRGLKLASRNEYIQYVISNKIYDLPLAAETVYGLKWTNWPDFLGNNRITQDNKIDFISAKKIISKFQFKSQIDFITWARSISNTFNVPIVPNKAYENEGWTDWDDFFGKPKILYLSFEDSRDWARKSSIKSSQVWFKSKDLVPENIPFNPQIYYKNEGWLGWADFLGTINDKNRVFLNFQEAKNYIAAFKIKSTNEWREWSKIHRPSNIPGSPDQYYKNTGWVSWSDFLGFDDKRNAKKLTYGEAKERIASFELKTSLEYLNFLMRDDAPRELPKKPQYFYKNHGWISWDDFLSKSVKIDYLDFEKAKTLIKGLGIDTIKKYKKYRLEYQLQQLPANPTSYYSDKWTGWDDYFGIERLIYFDFIEARDYVHGLNLGTKKDWKTYVKSTNFNSKLPRDPERFYGSAFHSWADWLGVKPGWKKAWRPYEDAKKFIHSLKLKNEADWRKYIKSGALPADIPKSPSVVYQEWRGMGDFLGTGNVAPTDREFLTFDEAKKIVRDFNIKNQRELKEFIKSINCPAGFPSNPNSTYKKQWKGLGDFLGTNTISPQDMVFYSYEEAKRYVIKNKIRNKEEYYELKRKNPLLPANPRLKFKEFKNWFDFLGKPEKEFYGFEELKLILKDKGIKTQSDYKAFQRLDSKAPSQPERVYKNEWKNYGDFLGTNSVANQNRKFFSFEEAKLYVKKFNLKTQKDFYAWCKKGFRPLDLPSNPQLAYKSKGWNGWADFLGKDIEK